MEKCKAETMKITPNWWVHENPQFQMEIAESSAEIAESSAEIAKSSAEIAKSLYTDKLKDIWITAD